MRTTDTRPTTSKSSKTSANAASQNVTSLKKNASSSETKEASFENELGTFIWFELKSPDVAASKKFYAAVFGWKDEATDMGAFTYSLIKAGDVSVGGFLPSDQKHAAFHSYLAVNDVDATAKAITKAGGSVVEAPVSIPTVGRMAAVKTPDGALFSVMKGETPHAPVLEKTGVFAWNELWATDEERTLRFVALALEQTHEAMTMPNGKYSVVLSAASEKAWGIMASPAPVSQFVPYVVVANTSSALAEAKSLGARIDMPATFVDGVGTIGVFTDPLGATIGVMTPPAVAH